MLMVFGLSAANAAATGKSPASTNLPARQLDATGRAPTALAAFVKRPQAVRFKSALTPQN
jgi:hypothetical protein